MASPRGPEKRMDGDDADRRKEQLGEAVDKARDSARKLAGWLGRKIEQTTDRLRENEAFAEPLEKLDQRRAERARDKLVAGLDHQYGDWSADLKRAIERLTERIEGLGKAVEQVQYNVNALRLRGAAKDDPELLEYTRQIADLRAEIEALHDAQQPFRDELEKLGRHYRSAVARLEADPGALAELQAQAADFVGESRRRLQDLTAEATDQADDA